MTDGAERTVRAYYDALRTGEPLAPFFVDDAGAVKFGISERLVGSDEIKSGLREQTTHTTDWAIESRALRVTERGCHAWFSDDVRMVWTDTREGVAHAFDSRWSGTLEHQSGEGEGAATDDGATAEDDLASDWQFVGMHVSTAGALE